ncbi:hypothetical protein PVAND_016185 [Polypedilum vanderplanki]|uniref:Uncharacterized protein n=1 Tax=Polypedilum vanderplanki TaxID=319348 RepID=A0A9J6BFF9_POLVA|nr:hypothetical protein PVAND_016185 [Polypedilum vanderplanki]
MVQKGLIEETLQNAAEKLTKNVGEKMLKATDAAKNRMEKEIKEGLERHQFVIDSAKSVKDVVKDKLEERDNLEGNFERPEKKFERLDEEKLKFLNENENNFKNKYFEFNNALGAVFQAIFETKTSMQVVPIVCSNLRKILK